ncbi:MAG: hypothetical protein LC794_00500 [Acidobacteria bacterium]|nr:hypothetical protein [Acidobacteriota bacterium]
MNRKTLLTLGAVLLFLGTAALYPQTNALAQDAYVGRTITGTAYFIGGRRPARSMPFRLIVNRLSTPDEVNQLNSALQSGGEEQLMRRLERMDAGRIEIGTGIGVPANFIIATDEGEGRTKLTVLYQRDIRFGELRYGTRRSDYRFGYAELHVGRGANEGMLIPAARVRLRDGNTWEVEDFGTFPARLMGLQVRGRGRNSVG